MVRSTYLKDLFTVLTVIRVGPSCQLPVVARVNKLQIGCPSCDPQLAGQYESIVVMSVDQIIQQIFNIVN